MTIHSRLEDDLGAAEEHTLAELDAARDSLHRAVDAALSCDGEQAHRLSAEAGDAERRYEDVHDRIMSLIARRSPVAGDLRLAMALLHVNERVQRMSAQCVNIGTLCMAIAEGVRPSERQLACLEAMGRLAEEQIVEARRVFAERDPRGVERIRAHDREINERNRSCFSLAIDQGRDDSKREAAFLVALMARAIERIGDNAVDIAQQASFAATGKLRIATGS